MKAKAHWSIRGVLAWIVVIAILCWIGYWAYAICDSYYWDRHGFPAHVH